MLLLLILWTQLYYMTRFVFSFYHISEYSSLIFSVCRNICSNIVENIVPWSFVILSWIFRRQTALNITNKNYLLYLWGIKALLLISRAKITPASFTLKINSYFIKVSWFGAVSHNLSIYFVSFFNLCHLTSLV